MCACWNPFELCAGCANWMMNWIYIFKKYCTIFYFSSEELAYLVRLVNAIWAQKAVRKIE